MDHTSTGAAPVKTGKADRRADLPFLVITLTLLGVGVVMVLSASFASAYYDLQGETGHNPVYFFSRQAIFAVLGLGVMFVISKIDYQRFRWMSVFVLGGSIVLMLMVPKNWKELQVTYMPTFAPDKTLTLTLKAADVIRG